MVIIFIAIIMTRQSEAPNVASGNARVPQNIKSILRSPSDNYPRNLYRAARVSADFADRKLRAQFYILVCARRVAAGC